MMDQNEILNKIRDFADQAHGDQMRKYTPERYIVHPVRVMETLKEYTQDLPVLAAALLHDVLEDTNTTQEQIYDFLKEYMTENEAKRTMRLVIELTDVYIKEDYPKLNRKKRKALETERVSKTSADSQTIKYADIMDNCNEIVKHDRHFAGVFLSECIKHMKVMDKGDPVLYKRTLELLETRMRELKRH
jgi:(p)ppGpp synthase/HD superfamily hydrolase